MSKLFCVDCNNLLTSISTSDNFVRKCIQCNKVYEVDDESTLVYDIYKSTNTISNNIFLWAGNDPVNEKVKKKCIKCDSNKCAKVYYGDDLKLSYVCCKCNYIQ